MFSGFLNLKLNALLTKREKLAQKHNKSLVRFCLVFASRDESSEKRTKTSRNRYLCLEMKPQIHKQRKGKNNFYVVNRRFPLLLLLLLLSYFSWIYLKLETNDKLS